MDRIGNSRIYLQLKSTDLDGQETYYEDLIQLDHRKDLTYKIMPNPVSRNGELRIQLDNKQDATVSIFNLNGQNMATKFLNQQDYVTFDMRIVEGNGLYVVKISTENKVYTEEIFVHN